MHKLLVLLLATIVLVSCGALHGGYTSEQEDSVWLMEVQGMRYHTLFDMPVLIQ